MLVVLHSLLIPSQDMPKGLMPYGPTFPVVRTHLVGIDIASSPDGHNVGVIGEHSEQHWAVILL